MSEKSQKKKPNYRRIILGLWIIFWVGILSVAGLFFGAAHGMLGELPTTEILENPKSFLASEIYTSDQQLMGKYYFENRSNASYDELPQHLIDALVATEDYRYYDHAGIDIMGLSRAFIKPLFTFRSAGGGSTITQQLALNLFDKRSFSVQERLQQKIKEYIISVRLEKFYTKKEILSMYLNTVEFGSNSFGIKAASKTFFNKIPDSLTVQESAVLVGMLKATTKYNPLVNYESSKIRRNTVLNLMVEHGYLTDSMADTLKRTEIEIRFQRSSHHAGQATYFREHLRSYLTKWCKTHYKVDGTPYNLYRDGLKVYTTIHSKMQQYAEESMLEHMPEIQGIFYDHWKGRKNAPFYGVTEKQIEAIVNQAVKRSDRYRKLRAADASEDSIKTAFNTPSKMKVFSWDGEIDTVMTPLDSIKYYKHYLHAGFMAMEPQTGFIRSWVGGINHKYFQYDHVNPGAKRQIGSTFKPVSYTHLTLPTSDLV